MVIFTPKIFAIFSTCIISLQAAGFHDYSSFGDEEKLITQLMKRHSLKVRPTACFRCTGAVIVNITYNVIQILAFSQAEETFSISGWFTLTWQDYRLNWSPNENGNITQVFLPSEKLWLPDVGVMNGRNNKDFDFSAQSQSRMSVSHDGHVTWMHGVILDVSCPLDVSYFPFDSQTCYIILTPWQSHVKQILMVPVQHGSTVDNSYLPNSNISEWIIVYVKFHYKTYVSQINITYQYISISIRVQRQPLYFIILVLVPFSMLSGLACLIFTLDDSGDRLTVALSLVLSMTMYVVIVSSNAPRSMRTLPVLCIYLLNQLGLLSVSTVLAVINQKLREKYRLSFWQDYQQARTIFNGSYFEESPLISDYGTDSPLATLKRAWQSQSYKNKNTESFNNSNLPINIKSFQMHQMCRPKQTGKENDVNKIQPKHPKDSIKKYSSKVSLNKDTDKKVPLVEEQNDSNTQFKGNVKEQKYYKRLANKLDRWELAIYLFISLINAIICLVLMPHYGKEE